GEKQAEGQALPATGTDAEAARKFVPGFVPTQGNSGQTVSTAGKGTGARRGASEGTGIDATSSPVNRKGRLSSPDNRPALVGATGLEPVTPSVSISDSLWPKKSGKASPSASYGDSRSFASTVEYLRGIASRLRSLRSGSVVLRSAAGVVSRLRVTTRSR